MFLATMKIFIDKFWSEEVWLPPNTTWEEITPGPDKDVVYTNSSDIFYPLPMALVLIFLRFLLEKYILGPFGKSLGIKDTRPRKAPSNPKLEAAYQISSKLKQQRLLSLAKQVDLSERQVERWWRLRRSQDKPSTLVKFCENAWKAVFYFLNFSFGVFVLWDKEWLWDIDQCYVGYPHQGITDDVWWYYMISSAFYWSLTISQFCDVRRRDFWQMFVHHFATITLLSFSWVCNLHRIGTLVLLLHDFADILVEDYLENADNLLLVIAPIIMNNFNYGFNYGTNIEIANKISCVIHFDRMVKASKYANYQKLCDSLFIALTISWILTRVGIYPFWIIWSTSIRAPMLLPMFPAYYIFNSLLCLLLLLHVVWTWLILQMLFNTIRAGKMEGDIRSSSELSDSPQNSSHNTPNRHKKKST